MNRLTFWIGLAVLGFLLYIAPGFLVHRMYEGFETAAAAPPTTPTPVNPVVNEIRPSTPPADVSQLLEAIHSLTTGITETPSIESPTAPTPNQTMGGAMKKQPEEHASQRSQPASSRDTPQPSEALKQGEGFNGTKPYPTDVDRAQRLAAIGGNGKQVLEVVSPMENPNCPDMRDYIRKDAIPCWSCNLK